MRKIHLISWKVKLQPILRQKRGKKSTIHPNLTGYHAAWEHFFDLGPILYVRQLQNLNFEYTWSLRPEKITDMFMFMSIEQKLSEEAFCVVSLKVVGFVSLNTLTNSTHSAKQLYIVSIAEIN